MPTGLEEQARPLNLRDKTIFSDRVKMPEKSKSHGITSEAKWDPEESRWLTWYLNH